MAVFPLIGVTPGFKEEEGSLFLKPFFLKAVRESGAVPLILPLPDSSDMPCPAALASYRKASAPPSPRPLSAPECTGVQISPLLQEALPQFWSEARKLALYLDGLLLTGGPDLHPLFFGEEVLPGCGTVCLLRDLAELAFFHAFFLQKKPILGICRGAQLINAALGGSLWQDIPSEAPKSRLCHSQPFSPGLVSHRVFIVQGSLLERILKASCDVINSGCGRAGTLRISSTAPLASPQDPLAGLSLPDAPPARASLLVNSLHHQAVRIPGAGLSACAFASDGIIEAVEHASYPFLLGVQWHPERLLFRKGETPNHPCHARALFSAFCQACRPAGS